MTWLFVIMEKFILQVLHLTPKVAKLNEWAQNTLYIPNMVIITLHIDLRSLTLDSFHQCYELP